MPPAPIHALERLAEVFIERFEDVGPKANLQNNESVGGSYYLEESIPLAIDLVMWTLNGEATLERSLQSIENAIPRSTVCHRYLVDGGSTDGTRQIAEKYGWTVVQARKRGIPFQANQGLELVDTAVFASFEQDVGLNPAWFKVLMPRLLSSSDIGVVQGLRAASGSKYLEAIDNYAIRHDQAVPWVYSIDNNLYRTDALKSVGGFPHDLPIITDGLLRNSLFEKGWRWKVYRDVVSKHYKDSFPIHLRTVFLRSALNRTLWETYPEYPMSSKFGRILTAPLTAARMASESHCPELLLGYPLLRVVKALGRIIGSIGRDYRVIQVRSQS